LNFRRSAIVTDGQQWRVIAEILSGVCQTAFFRAAKMLPHTLNRLTGAGEDVQYRAIERTLVRDVTVIDLDDEDTVVDEQVYAFLREKEFDALREGARGGALKDKEGMKVLSLERCRNGSTYTRVLEDSVKRTVSYLLTDCVSLLHSVTGQSNRIIHCTV
jgi:hypothetical protein